MLNTANKKIALAIGAAYCNGSQESPCAVALYNRLNTYLNDASFVSMLSTLTSKKINVSSIRPIRQVGTKLLCDWTVLNLIDGWSGSFQIEIPSSLFMGADKWKKIIEWINSPYHTFLSYDDNNIVFTTSESGGYSIAYTTTPTSGGGSGSGSGSGSGDEGGGGGQIIVPSPFNPGTVDVYDTPAAKSGFDYQSLLIPGAILAAVYFFMNKK